MDIQQVYISPPIVFPLNDFSLIIFVKLLSLKFLRSNPIIKNVKVCLEVQISERERKTIFNDKFNGGYSLDECLGLDGVNPKNKRGE